MHSSGKIGRAEQHVILGWKNRDGDGRITGAGEFVMTGWTPGARSDMEALRAVFDSNGNGRLDAGDAQWAKFGAVVDGQFRTLAALGIASIELTPDNRVVRFADGSSIGGVTRFTRTDGTTGLAADASLAAASEGFRLAQETSTDAAGATRVVTRVFDTAGVLRERHVRVTSADGATVTTTSDLDGKAEQRTPVTNLAGGAARSRNRERRRTYGCWIPSRVRGHDGAAAKDDEGPCCNQSNAWTHTSLKRLRPVPLSVKTGWLIRGSLHDNVQPIVLGAR